MGRGKGSKDPVVKTGAAGHHPQSLAPFEALQTPAWKGLHPNRRLPHPIHVLITCSNLCQPGCALEHHDLEAFSLLYKD